MLPWLHSILSMMTDGMNISPQAGNHTSSNFRHTFCGCHAQKHKGILFLTLYKIKHKGCSDTGEKVRGMERVQYEERLERSGLLSHRGDK